MIENHKNVTVIFFKLASEKEKCFDHFSVSQDKLVEWIFGPVKECKLLDPVSSLQVIPILHRGGAQIPSGHLVQ